MSSTAEYLTQLISDRDDLADNLVTMGVQATHSETITELVPKVLDIAGGGGVAITDITLNADGTYTVTDANADTHTLAVTETDGQITAITYDGDNVPLTFSSGELTGVGDTDIDVSRYPEPQSSGSGTIPFSNIFDCLEKTELAGLKQSTAPTTTGDNPQVYEDENHTWHNLYWLDDSATPNVWKKYNTVTEQWDLVNGGNE